MPGNKFFMEKQMPKYKIEMSVSKERKFAMEGSPNYKFYTDAAAKFTRPFPNEFKVSKLDDRSIAELETKSRNRKASDILQSVDLTKFAFFLISNEGVFIRNNGVMNNVDDLTDMLETLEKLSSAMVNDRAE